MERTRADGSHARNKVGKVGFEVCQRVWDLADLTKAVRGDFDDEEVVAIMRKWVAEGCTGFMGEGENGDLEILTLPPDLEKEFVDNCDEILGEWRGERARQVKRELGISAG